MPRKKEVKMAYPDYISLTSEIWGISPEMAVGMLIVIGVWSLIWKGFALWKSAEKKQLVWFIALLIINTVGILEILYIFIFSKMSKKQKTTKSKLKSNKKR